MTTFPSVGLIRRVRSGQPFLAGLLALLGAILLGQLLREPAHSVVEVFGGTACLAFAGLQGFPAPPPDRHRVWFCAVPLGAAAGFFSSPLLPWLCSLL